jgi:hypothetical protein
MINPSSRALTLPAGARVGVDVLDVFRDEFLIAGDAWLRCRVGLVYSGKFVASPLDQAGYRWIAAIERSCGTAWYARVYFSYDSS